MQVTLQQLREWFAVFNQRYFEGKLIEPRFAVGKSRTRLGSLSWKVHRKLLFGVKCDYTIRLSNYYDVEECDFKNVLLHEMIHLYIEAQHVKDTSSHGVVFRRMMRIINEDGWNITVSGRIDNEKRAESVRKKRSRVVLAVTTTSGKCLLSVVNPHYVRKINVAMLTARDIRSYSWYVSADDYFSSFPIVRSPKGRIVPPEVFAEKMSSMQQLNPINMAQAVHP